YREASQDLAAGTIVSSYTAFCGRSGDRVHEALEEIERDPESFSPLLPATIAAGTSINMNTFLAAAIRLFDHTNLELKSQAVFSVTTMQRSNGSTVPESVFLALEKVAADNSDDRVLAATVRAAFSLFQRDK